MGSYHFTSLRKVPVTAPFPLRRRGRGLRNAQLHLTGEQRERDRFASSLISARAQGYREEEEEEEAEAEAEET